MGGVPLLVLCIPLVVSASAEVSAVFEPPVVAYTASNTHGWFSQILDPGTGPLVLSVSLGGDGTTAQCPGTCAGVPGPRGCPATHRNSTGCSVSLMSTDHGRTWHGLPKWLGANEILQLPSPTPHTQSTEATNGTFVTLPYRVTVDPATNLTATSVSGYARVDSAGVYTHDPTSDFKVLWTAPPGVRWPATLVHSGTVVRLADGSHLTTLYGHGSGSYRKWDAHPATYFARSTDLGRSWAGVSEIPWQPAYGNSSDGPAEPNMARLPDGTLWCVYRSDATEFYWSAVSRDEGRSWGNVTPLNFSWSVRPQLRVTSRGLLVLTGGRPGINIWASGDRGATWTRFNIAAEHNRLLNGTDDASLLTYDQQVVAASGPHFPRASPEPQTTSYTGLTEAADGALVVSYDRLANGWKDRVWAVNGTLLPGCWGTADRVFTMRVMLT